jgi:hypothetical protein
MNFTLGDGHESLGSGEECFGMNMKCPPQTHVLNTWSQFVALFLEVVETLGGMA